MVGETQQNHDSQNYKLSCNSRVLMHYEID